MKRTLVACGLLLTVSTLAIAQTLSEPQIAARKAAMVVRDAMLKGDYGAVIDTMPENLVTVLGGRENAVAAVDKAMAAMKAAGFVVTNYTLGEPGKVHTGKDAYIVLPATLEMKAPMGRVISNSFILGISTDQGKTWKFVDGAHLDDKTKVAKLFPDFAESLKLPAKTPPKFLKN